jgi:lambda repressor-like predicted transcriptional regulator
MNRTRWLVTAVAALAVVLGGGAALASAGSNDPASDFFGDVAKRLGISQDKLEDAIKDATIARIDAAVAAGDITKEEGDALKERVRSGDVPAILPSFRDPPGDNGVFGPDGWFGPGHLAGPDLLDTAADYLGMTEAAVREALRDGKSLADLAKAKGKSVDGLKNALRNEIRKDADQAVEDGELTRAQADRLVEKFSNALDKLVEASGRPGLDFGFGFRGPGFGPGPLGPLEKGVIPDAFPGTDLMERAADYLGMTEAAVREALRDGKSLADLAKGKGKSVDGLKNALRNEIRTDADQAVEDGVLTRAQADRLVEKFGNGIDKLVDGSLRSGFDFDFRSDGGNFEFHFQIAPEGRMPLPEGRDENPSLEPAIVPSSEPI